MPQARGLKQRKFGCLRPGTWGASLRLSVRAFQHLPPHTTEMRGRSYVPTVVHLHLSNPPMFTQTHTFIRVSGILTHASLHPHVPGTPHTHQDLRVCPHMSISVLETVQTSLGELTVHISSQLHEQSHWSRWENLHHRDWQTLHSHINLPNLYPSHPPVPTHVYLHSHTFPSPHTLL